MKEKISICLFTVVILAMFWAAEGLYGVMTGQHDDCSRSFAKVCNAIRGR